MNEGIKVFLISMLPILELRGAIPIGLFLYHLNLKTVLFWSVLGNIVPPLFILLCLEKIVNYFSSKSALTSKFIKLYFGYLRGTREKRIIQLGKYLALISFVAIPLPFTGAWTGAICAFLFGIRAREAYPLIIIGVLIAAFIVSISLLGFKAIFGL